LARLLTTNAGDRRVRAVGRVLIYGDCVEVMWPEIFRQMCKGRFPLAVCLENEHMNIVGFKLATMIRICKPKEVVTLTIDGSPHCVQLHMMVEEVRKLLKDENTVFRYFVVEKGDLIEVDSRCVRTARYLSKIKKLLEVSDRNNIGISPQN